MVGVAGFIFGARARGPTPRPRTGPEDGNPGRQIGFGTAPDPGRLLPHRRTGTPPGSPPGGRRRRLGRRAGWFEARGRGRDLPGIVPAAGVESGRERPMKFTKMHGIGNDYVYVSTFDQEPPADPARLAIARQRPAFRHRRRRPDPDRPVASGPTRGCGCSTPTARSRRCAATASAASPSTSTTTGSRRKPRVTVETGRGVLTLDLEVEAGKARRVRVDMGAPILRGVRHPDARCRATRRSTCRCAVDGHDARRDGRLDGQPARGGLRRRRRRSSRSRRSGPLLEHHPAFPRRVNAHFVEVLGPDEVRMRTWERGSGITLACGTGACAVCVAGVLTGRTGRNDPRPPARRRPRARVARRRPSVFMTGPATEVFSGEWPE